MALLNGDTDARDRSVSPVQHLGKRKRTVTPDAESSVSADADTAQQDIVDAVQVIKRHDLNSAVLTFPLPVRGDDGRTIKRQRVGTPERENDTIQTRISRLVYKSVDDLIIDVNAIKNALASNNLQENGFPNSVAATKQQIDAVWESLSKYRSKSSDASSPPSSPTKADSESQDTSGTAPSNQLLSLRSQTESGIRQLFSGLPLSQDSARVDGRRLPNGFELADALTSDTNDLQQKDVRKFGDVFAAHRNVKTLEMPRAGRTLHDNTLSFIPPFENVANSSRNDFKFANLSTSIWLKYANTDKPNHEASDKSGIKAPIGDALFKGAYSSFAPTTDNSRAMVTDFDRSQQWWRKYGRVIPGEPLSLLQIQDNVDAPTEDAEAVSDQDLEEMIANFISEDDHDQESKDLLEEISEMIETLASYQSIRHLEVAKGPSSASKPSTDEQATYDMLRNQLQLLVCSLPPYAVSKLNGHQLDELNISTHMLISTPEFVGTGQVDDYTIRRTRAAQVSSSAVGRSTAPVASRATYGTPASAYNAQARAYNNMPSSAYGARPPSMPAYSTPRPPAPTPAGAYAQPQYRPNGPTIHTPSVQQFQRPVVNGFVSTPTPASQTPYSQRPPQPSHPQRFPDGVTYGQTPKPTINGDMTKSQPRQYTMANTYSANTPNALGQQKTVGDLTKLQQASNLTSAQSETPASAVAANS